MFSKSFFASLGGRLFAAIFGFSLAGSGVLTLLGPGQLFNRIIWMVALLSLTAVVFAVILSLEEFFAEAMVLLLALPFVGQLYFIGLYSLGRSHSTLGEVLLLTGFIVGGLGIYGAHPKTPVDAFSGH